MQGPRVPWRHLEAATRRSNASRTFREARLSESPATASTSTSRASSSSAAVFSSDAAAHAFASSDSSKSWTSRISARIFGESLPASAETATPSSSTGNDVTLLKLKHECVQNTRAKRKRIAAMYAQVEAEGQAHLLSPFELRCILSTVSKPVKGDRHLDIEAVIAQANAYGQMTRSIFRHLSLQQSPPTEHDLRRVLHRYAWLKYAPAVYETWNDLVKMGHVPSSRFCRYAFKSLADWVRLHDELEGQLPAEQAAHALSPSVVSMLHDVSISGQPTAREDLLDILPAALHILVRARDFKTFNTLVRTLFGLDVDLPGALVDPTAPHSADLLVLRPEHLFVVLQSLAAQDNLSKMMAVFEVFDTPEASFASASSFFGTSFPPSSAAYSRERLITTSAFEFMITTAMRLGRSEIARMYFGQLCERWDQDISTRLERDRRAIGLHSFDSVNVTDADKPETLRTPEASSAWDSISGEPLRLQPVLIERLFVRCRTESDAAMLNFLHGRIPSILKMMQKHLSRSEAILVAHSQLSPPVLPSYEINWLRRVAYQSSLTEQAALRETVARRLGESRTLVNLRRKAKRQQRNYRMALLATQSAQARDRNQASRSTLPALRDGQPPSSLAVIDADEKAMTPETLERALKLAYREKNLIETRLAAAQLVIHQCRFEHSAFLGNFRFKQACEDSERLGPARREIDQRIDRLKAALRDVGLDSGQSNDRASAGDGPVQTSAHVDHEKANSR